MMNTGNPKKIINDIKNSPFVQNLKRQMEENPVIVIVAVTGLLAAGAKLINAWGHTQGSRAYARQVDYRISKNSRFK
jgi:hypothetical protein